MQSTPFEIMLSNCSQICPIGYVLLLAQTTLNGQAGSCNFCAPGTYSVNPLGGSSPGIPSCLKCPAGGDCLLGGSSVKFSVGDWILHGDMYVLINCPAGYQLVNSTDGSSFGTFSHDLQQCSPCKQSEYIVNQRESCQTCPTGAVCNGTDGSLVGLAGSYFRAEGDKMRVYQCDPGYILVRDDTGNRARSFLDSCIMCLPGSYSLNGAMVTGLGHCVRNGSSSQPYNCPSVSSQNIVGFLDEISNGSWTESPELAQQVCQTCPAQAKCTGGSTVLPMPGYWTNNASISRRIIATASISIYSCPPGACLGNGQCAEGRTGPVCGVCEPGWAMTSTSCQQCPSDERLYNTEEYSIAAVGSLLAAVVFYFFSFRPILSDEQEDEAKDFLEDQVDDSYNDNDQDKFKQKTGMPNIPRLHVKLPAISFKTHVSVMITHVNSHFHGFGDIGAFFQGYLKVIIGFFQVLTAFTSSFSVHWPLKVSNLFQNAVFFRFDLISLPGPSCIAAKANYAQKLITYTLFPVVVIVVLFITPALSYLLMFLRKDHASKIKNEKVWNQFWYSLMFFLFLVYPTVSMASFRSFDCDDVGLSYLLLRADYNEECPYSLQGQSVFGTKNFIFWWSFVCLFVYPLGIPFFFLAVMWYYKVPALAQAKLNAAKIHALISNYRKCAMPLEVEILVQQLSVSQLTLCDSALDQRIELLFRVMSNENQQLSLEQFVHFFKNPLLGIPDASERTIRQLFQAKDTSHDGSLNLEEFSDMMHQIVLVHRLFTGHEQLADMYFEQLWRLYEFHANGKIYLEIEEDDDGAEGKKEKGIDPSLVMKNVAASILDRTGLSKSSKEKDTTGTSQHEEAHGLEKKYPGAQKILKLRKEMSAEQFAELQLSIEPDLRQKVLALGNTKIENGSLVLPSIAWNKVEDEQGADSSVQESQEEQDEKLAMLRVGFLIKNYNVQSWYFELVEMSRKLFMTSIVTFVYQGSAAQLVAALVVTLLSLVHILYAQPFLDHKIGNTQTYALVAQCMTLIYGLTIIVQTLSDSLHVPQSFEQASASQ